MLRDFIAGEIQGASCMMSYLYYLRPMKVSDHGWIPCGDRSYIHQPQSKWCIVAPKRSIPAVNKQRYLSFLTRREGEVKAETFCIKFVDFVRPCCTLASSVYSSTWSGNDRPSLQTPSRPSLFLSHQDSSHHSPSPF